MRDNEEKSYERYKQYRRNRYRYEYEQKIFPVILVFIGALIIRFRKQIVIASIIVVLLIITIFLYGKYRQKQMKAKQPLVLTREEARQGTELNITLNNAIQPTTLNITTPANADNGQRFVVRNISIKNEQGKVEKKDIWFVIEVHDQK